MLKQKQRIFAFAMVAVMLFAAVEPMLGQTLASETISTISTLDWANATTQEIDEALENSSTDEIDAFLSSLNDEDKTLLYYKNDALKSHLNAYYSPVIATSSAITFSPSAYVPTGEPKATSNEETTITTETNESTTVSTSDSKEDETSVKTETSSSIDIEETDDSGLISDNDNNLNTKASPGKGDFQTGTLTYKFSDGVNSGGKYSSSTQIQISWQGWWHTTNSTGKWSAIYFTSRKPSAPASEYDEDHGLQNFILSEDYNVKELPVSGDIPHNSGGKTSNYFNLSSIPSNARYLVLRGSGSDVHCYIRYDGPTSDDIDSTAPTVTYSAPAGFKNPSTNAEWYADSVDVTIKATDSASKVTEIIDSKEFPRYLREDDDSIYIQYTKTLK